MEPAIEVRDVFKSYRRYAQKHKFLTLKSALLNRSLFSELKGEEVFQALRGVSLEVPRGRTISIIGENGSGKSTLLKILSGVSRPTGGEVLVRGRISALIELGAGFHPEISGRENIAINGAILGLSRKQIQERMERIVRFAELEEFIDNPVKSYSSGMYMRLGFSIAVHVDPEILLIDEILAVGDASFVPKCLDRIQEFKSQGRTIVFVSHDLATVERISDEVIWMKDGLIRMRGYPQKVVDAYLEYVGKRDEERGVQSREEDRQELELERDDRWGSQEVSLHRVRLLDASGRERYVFTPHEPITLTFEVHSAREQEDVVFGFGVHASDGTRIYGTNTHLERLVSRSVSGKGQVTLTLPAMNLVNGTYTLDVAAHKREGFPFDYHHGRYSFRIHGPYRDVGLARMEHEWAFSPEVVMERQDGGDED